MKRYIAYVRDGEELPRNCRELTPELALSIGISAFENEYVDDVDEVAELAIGVAISEGFEASLRYVEESVEYQHCVIYTREAMLVALVHGGDGVGTAIDAGVKVGDYSAIAFYCMHEDVMAKFNELWEEYLEDEADAEDE